MQLIAARNINDAYPLGLALLARIGKSRPSRNGPVLVAPEPVTTHYIRPHERVLFDPQRNANPFFHLFEALWMLNGQQDVATMTQFLPRMLQYSDDSETFHGAYGHRWRHWPMDDARNETMDQLTTAIACLRENPDDRRVIIQMWDPVRDLASSSRDVPCNQSVHVQIAHNMLDICVFCRSNDIIYGCYGANAVHFSFLHEYLAGMIGVSLGEYWQISTNFHAYVESPYRWSDYWPTRLVREGHLVTDNPYDERTPSYCCPYPLIVHSEAFDVELMAVMRAVSIRQLHFVNLGHFENQFFARVVQPMYAAFRQYKAKRIDAAVDELRRANADCPCRVDWLVAGEEWLLRARARMLGLAPERESEPIA